MVDSPAQQLGECRLAQGRIRRLTQKIQRLPQQRLLLADRQGGGMVLFGELKAARLQGQWQMQPGWLGALQQTVEGDLAHCGFEQIRATHHLRDTAVGIVDHHRQIVGKQAIAPLENKIFSCQCPTDLDLA